MERVSEGLNIAVPFLRFYARTLSDIYDILPSAYGCPRKEIQIVLPFARDYDQQETYRNGEFIPYFYTKITPQDIQKIKSYAPPSIKFFLSIGGRDRRFPFAVNSNDQSQTWIRNATESLTTIIQEYHIDGIDVYYEHINSDAIPYFADSLKAVIWNLRGGNNIVTKASITVSYPLISVYLDLRTSSASANLLDSVVYQLFSVTHPIHTPQDLVNVFHELSGGFPREKSLAGYSDFPSDQTIVSPEIFFVALAQLLREGPLGISMWYGNPAP